MDAELAFCCALSGSGTWVRDRDRDANLRIIRQLNQRGGRVTLLRGQYALF